MDDISNLTFDRVGQSIKPRITQQEQYVVAYLLYLRDLVLEAFNNQWFSPNDQVQFNFGDLPHQEFNLAFPNCRRIGSVLTDGFHVKKFFHPLPTRTVTYFVRRLSFAETPPEASTVKGLIAYYRGSVSNIGHVLCSNGEITDLEVEKRRGRLPHRCGFGSMLTYFCFLDTDHLSHQSGYQINNNNHPNNPWNHPAMIQLRDGPSGFNNDVCSKIIYIKYENRPGYHYTPHGNKAIIYAAYADDYEDLVTYIPVPFCNANQNVGNVFRVRNVLQRVTMANPQNPGARINDILGPYGNDWYFCKRSDLMKLLFS